jgi:hypothetical protein
MTAIHEPTPIDIELQLPLSDAYEARMLALFPTAADIVEQRRIADDNLQSRIERQNEESGIEILRVLPGAGSPTWQAMSRLTAQLAYSTETKEEYVEAVYDAKIASMRALSDTLVLVNLITEDERANLRADIEADAEVLYTERLAASAIGDVFVALDDYGREQAVKLLLHRPDPADPREEQLRNALITGLATPRPHGEPILESIITQLRNGELDRIIYELAMNNEMNGSRTASLRAMTDLILAVGMRLRPDLPEGDIVREIGQEVGLFINGSINEIHQMRQDSVLRLEKELNHARTRQGIPGQRRNVELLKTQLALHSETFTYEISQRYLSRLERDSVNRKRREITQQLKNIEQGTEHSEVKRENFKPRDVFAARNAMLGFEPVTGEEGAQHIADMIQAYVDRHPGAKMLKEDLEAAVAFIRNIDFSQGLVRGVQKHADVILGDSTAVLYGLKPMDAQGVLKHSKAMNQTRLYFLIDSEGVGYLLRIMDRDEANAYIISLGLGSKRRRG